jgi:hypothetical protein
VARSADGTTACRYACCTGVTTPIAAMATRKCTTADPKESTRPTAAAATASTADAATSNVVRRPQKRVR